MVERDLAHFQSIHWCAALLRQPNTIVTPTRAREYKENTADAIFAETLNTDDTIRACLTLFKQPTSGADPVNEVHMLLTLGYRVNGYPHRTHRGIVALIIDERIGSLLYVMKDMLSTIPSNRDCLTVYLTTNYVKPVATPQTVLVSARTKDIVGRKYFLEATIKDSDGVVLAKADSLWIGVDEPKEKL